MEKANLLKEVFSRRGNQVELSWNFNLWLMFEALWTYVEVLPPVGGCICIEFYFAVIYVNSKIEICLAQYNQEIKYFKIWISKLNGTYLYYTSSKNRQQLLMHCMRIKLVLHWLYKMKQPRKKILNK